MSIKDIRRNYIIKVVENLFFEQSMVDVKIKDIAARAEIGEATFYRYFPNRSMIIIACAVHMQEEIGKKYFVMDESDSGYGCLRTFYYRFYEIFKDHREYFKFLSEFDAYCTGAERKGLEKYSQNMNVFKHAYDVAYQKGVEDGSVREISDIDMFYYASTHALLSLCKKLAAEGNITKQDEALDRIEEVKTVVDIILAYLKKD